MIHNPQGPIDIVLVSWYRPEMTELVIRTIKANTRPGNYRLIVVDNSSPKEQQDMLNRLYGEGLIFGLLLNSENLGLEPARNQGLSHVTSQPYFICADNDCLPQKIDQDGYDWIDHLVYLMDNQQIYAALSCRTQVMIGTGNIFEDEEKDITEFAHPGGSLRIMVTESVRLVGGWRDDVEGRGSEEKYICSKLHEIGMKTGFATKIKTLHLFGTRGEDGTDRWGYPADWEPEQTGHSDIWHPVLGSGDDIEEVRKYADI